jgi:hypothetical protein
MNARVSMKPSRAAVAELDFNFDDEPDFDIDVVEPEPIPGGAQPLELASVKAAIVRWLEQQA